MKFISPKTRIRLGVWLLLLSSSAVALAGSATWSPDPSNFLWNDPNHWVPQSIPDGPDDVATFTTSNELTVLVDKPTELNALVFGLGAEPFDLLVEGDFFQGQVLNLSGTGVINQSGIVQTLEGRTLSGSFQVGGTVQFTQHATVGAMVNLVARGGLSRGSGAKVQFLDFSSAGEASISTESAIQGGSGGGFTIFADQSTAGDAVVTNFGATVKNREGGTTQFKGTASAGRGLFTNSAAIVPSATAGATEFLENSSAADATFINVGSTRDGSEAGVTRFFDTVTAADATLIANGDIEPGSIEFYDASDGGTARVQLIQNGELNISSHLAPGVTIGSLEGSGVVELGERDLSVGTNGLGTSFSGVIQGNGGLVKLGAGTLQLISANSYSGGTTVNEGALAVYNRSGFATGSGPVQVNAGVLGGQGTIAGAVTLGSGSGAGAVLAPGQGAAHLARLQMESSLTWKSDGSYRCRLNTKKGKSDQVLANGVTIESGAQFNLQVIGQERLRPGRSATLLDNTSATPIAGTFANLPDGATISAGPNTLQVSYSGGDGNDLTLTAVR